MEKKKKWIIIGILTIAIVLTASVLFFAGGYRIKFEETFAKDLSFEYGQESDVPKAYVVNMFGIRQFGEVEYTFTSAEGVETVTKYPVAKCDSVGDWKVTCSYKTAKVVKEFQVVDTVAPEIIIGALPSDVYVGNTDVEYTVPGVDFKDSSPIDYNNSSVALYFEGEEVQYNTLTNAFVPEKDGEYIFKVKAMDIYGNTAEEECKWRAKDPNWTDANLPDGYLATFDSVDYANLISSGFINQYWSGTETEEFLEEYEGEKGVLKVRSSYNAEGLTAFKVKLAKTITPEELEDDVIIIRYRVDDKNTNGRLTLAGNYQESIQSAAAKYFDYTPGEWQTAILTAEDLPKYAYADEDGVLRTLQFGFGRNGSGSAVDVYLASVTIGKKLDTPQNLRASGASLKWDAVKGATGYYLFIDGEEIEVDASVTSYQLGKNKIFKVRAKGDGIFTVDSDEAIYVNATVADGYLAEFDEEYYQYLVWNNGAGTEGGMEWYESDFFEASYDEKEKATKLDLTQGYVSAGVVVRIPKTVETASLDNVVIRFKTDGNVKCVRVYQYGGPGLMIEQTGIQEGWNTIVIPKSVLLGDANDVSKFSGYQLIFFANEKPVNGKGQGTKMTIHLGEVTNATQLGEPTNLKLSGNTLSWDAVANAKGYVVEEDGKEYKVSGTSYTIKGGELFKVSATGDNRFYVDSQQAIFVNGSVPDGYLATFDKAYYEYMVWNNGATAPGGMQWYESDSHKVAFDANSKTVRVDMTYGYVAAGSVIRFPKAVKVSELNDVVVRVKLDDSVKQVAFYQYGGQGQIYKTTAVVSGWNDIVIPHSALLADAGSEDTMSGMQIILYNNAEGLFGNKQGDATTMYLGSITNVQKLETPKNLKIENNVLSWEKVDGATKYYVYEDGQRYVAETCTHTLHGGELIKVQAVGDGTKTIDSDYAIYVNGRVSEGYLAEFDKEFYNYLIWNNGANQPGGMQYYESNSFEAQWNGKTGDQATMDVTAQYGWVCAGMVVKFPQGKALDPSKDVVLNIKLDDTVKGIRVYPYGVAGQVYISSEVNSGWNKIVISNARLATALGESNFEGLQIMLFDNAACENTVNNPAMTANVSLGKILYEEPTVTTTEVTPILIEDDAFRTNTDRVWLELGNQFVGNFTPADETSGVWFDGEKMTDPIMQMNQWYTAYASIHLGENAVTSTSTLKIDGTFVNEAGTQKIVIKEFKLYRKDGKWEIGEPSSIEPEVQIVDVTPTLIENDDFRTNTDKAWFVLGNQFTGNFTPVDDASGAWFNGEKMSAPILQMNPYFTEYCSIYLGTDAVTATSTLRLDGVFVNEEGTQKIRITDFTLKRVSGKWELDDGTGSGEDNVIELTPTLIDDDAFRTNTDKAWLNMGSEYTGTFTPADETSGVWFNGEKMTSPGLAMNQWYTTYSSIYLGTVTEESTLKIDGIFVNEDGTKIRITDFNLKRVDGRWELDDGSSSGADDAIELIPTLIEDDAFRTNTDKAWLNMGSEYTGTFTPADDASGVWFNGEKMAAPGLAMNQWYTTYSSIYLGTVTEESTLKIDGIFVNEDGTKIRITDFNLKRVDGRWELDDGSSSGADDAIELIPTLIEDDAFRTNTDKAWLNMGSEYTGTFTPADDASGVWFNGEKMSAPGLAMNQWYTTYSSIYLGTVTEESTLKIDGIFINEEERKIKIKNFKLKRVNGKWEIDN